MKNKKGVSDDQIEDLLFQTPLCEVDSRVLIAIPGAMWIWNQIKQYVSNIQIWRKYSTLLRLCGYSTWKNNRDPLVSHVRNDVFVMGLHLLDSNEIKLNELTNFLADFSGFGLKEALIRNSFKPVLKLYSSRRISGVSVSVFLKNIKCYLDDAWFKLDEEIGSLLDGAPMSDLHLLFPLLTISGHNTIRVGPKVTKFVIWPSLIAHSFNTTETKI